MLNYLIRDLIQNLSSSIQFKGDASDIEFEISSYIRKLYDKLRLTKNVLFRNRPIDFYENYIPLKLRFENEIISSRDTYNFFENGKKIVILGSAGSGKTTLLKYFALRCYDDNIGLIPIFLELRNYNEDKSSFEEFVSRSISEKVQVNELFTGGKFVFILDGFDEINFIGGKDIISQIEKFISKYGSNTFIITSRPGTNIESMSQFYVYEIEPLNENDISLFVQILEIPNKIRNSIFHHLKNDNIFYQYLTNPLFLSLYINYVNYHTLTDIPSKKSVFFRSILDTLFSQHDSVSKLGYVREKLSGLNKDELENVCSILAFRALTSSSKSFSKDKLYNELQMIRESTGLFFENENIIYDLTITVNVLVNDSNYFSFTHIIFLEYLASLFISRLPLAKREKVYEKFTHSVKIYYSTSFLNFLYELDYQYFIKSFILPVIEKYLDSPNSSYDDTKKQVLYFLWSVYDDKNNEYYSYNDNYVIRHNLSRIYKQLKNEVTTNDDDNIDELLNFE